MLQVLTGHYSRVTVVTIVALATRLVATEAAKVMWLYVVHI